MAGEREGYLNGHDVSAIIAALVIGSMTVGIVSSYSTPEIRPDCGSNMPAVESMIEKCVLLAKPIWSEPGLVNSHSPNGRHGDVLGRCRETALAVHCPERCVARCGKGGSE